jgi:hypothetical protein
MMVEVFCTSKKGAEVINVSVGFSAPDTLGSSVLAKTTPLRVSCPWFSTMVVLVMTGARTASNETDSVSLAPILRLSTVSVEPYAHVLNRARLEHRRPVESIDIINQREAA